MPDRALLYARLSDPKDPNAPTLDAQEALLRAHCAKKGYVVIDVLREAHTAAVLRERPKIREALELLSARAADVFLVRDLDRLVREQWSLAVFMDLVRERGGRVEFALEDFEDTPVGKFVLAGKAFAAEYEREKMRWRTMAGKRRIAEAGQLHRSGLPLYGYVHNKESRRREIDKIEADIVRQMFAWVAEERLSERQVWRRLNDLGTPSPGADRVYKDGRVPRWSKAHVHRILTDCTYRGEGYAWRYMSGGLKHNTVSRPRADWLPLLDTPAIIEPSVWDNVQRRLQSNTGADTRNLRLPALLRGCIFCDVCGAPLWVQRGRSLSRKTGEVTGHYLFYRCSARDSADSAGGRCGAGQVLARVVEAAVWEQVSTWLTSGAWQREKGPARRRKATPARDTSKERARLEAQHEQYLRLYGEATSERQREGAKRHMARLAAELDALDAAPITPTAPAPLDFLSQRAQLEHLAATAAELDFEGRRAALEWLGVQVRAKGRESRIVAPDFLTA